jgi:small subunit ribosomal protein S6
MSTNRQYELVYVMTPESSDEQIAELHTQIEQIVQRYEGTFDKTENWGRRKLAYEIGHHREGNYVVETISGSGELMKEIDRRLRVLDSVIRHLVVRVDAEIRVADRTRDARKATQARRRPARGLPPEPQPGEGRCDNMDGDDDRGDKYDRADNSERGDRGDRYEVQR